MKVLYILPWVCGADWAVTAVRRLSELGVEMVAVLPREQGDLTQRFREIGVPVMVAPLFSHGLSPAGFGKRMASIAELVAGERPHILHCHSMTDALLLRLAHRRGQGPPRVFQSAVPPLREGPAVRLAQRCISDSRDYWAGSSPEVCTYYTARGIPESRVFLCPYGGEPPKPLPRRNVPPGIRDRLGIPAQSPLIALDATDALPREQATLQERFIRAAAIVLTHRPEARAVILSRGDEPEKVALRLLRLARELCGESLYIAPVVQTLAEAYREVSLAVHPAVIQSGAGAAMWQAAGIPTVSGENGDERLLADRILYQLENRRPPSRRSGERDRAPRNYPDARDSATVTLKMYERILGG